MARYPVQILCAAFFGSGAAALVFEALWFRQAALAFGSSVWSSTLVLSSFMAGLAAGNALALRFGEHIRRPVRAYALLEAGVAATGAALVLALPELGRWLAPRLGRFGEAPWVLNSARFGISFGLLLLPATAMGATLPILVRALRARDPSFGAVLGRLYGFNTLGAVLGALAAETWLVAWFGVRGAALAAAGLSLLAAGMALPIARVLDVAPGTGVSGTAAALPARAIGARAWLLAAASLLSGGILLAFEVVWFRFLRLFVSPDALSFSLMLAVVLSGIGAGGLVAGRLLARSPRACRHAPALAWLSGATAVALYAGLLKVAEPYAALYARTAVDVLWLSSALMLPVALLSGVLFTFTGAALQQELAVDIRSAGLLTLANTLGGALGSFAAGFLLLPRLGVEGSIAALAALYGVAGGLLLAARSEGSRAPLLGFRIAALCSLALALVALPFGSLQVRYLQMRAGRFGYPDTAAIEGVREGRSETVIYLSHDNGAEPLFHRMLTGAFSMASSSVLARRYMKLFVYWPVALHPELETALLISYGIGTTAKALTDTKRLTRIDVVDISREILEMSDLAYPDPREHPLRDRRVTVHVEDGRFFLQTRGERYDLITSEPPPPKHAGVVSLYTREYFQLIRDHLEEGGVSTYWLPVHQLTLGDTKAILRAYCDAFPDCSLWSGYGTNWMLVGIREPRRGVSEAAFSAQWRDPRVAPELRTLGLELPEQLGATFLADAEGLRAFVGDALPLTDDHPKRLSDRRPDAADGRGHAAWLDARQARLAFERSDWIRRAWPAELRERTLPFFRWQELLNDASAISGGALPIGQRIRNLDALLSDSPLRTLVLWQLGIRGSGAGALPDTPARRAGHALADRDYEAAAAHYTRALAESPSRFSRYLQLYARCRAGQLERAAAAAPRSLAARVAQSACVGFPEHAPELPDRG